MTLTPTFFINNQRLRLDRDAHIREISGEKKRIVLEAGCSDEQCVGCGEDISQSGLLIGNPTIRTEQGYDDCSVECEVCCYGYPVIWKEMPDMYKIIVCDLLESHPTVKEVESPWHFTKQLLADDHDKDPTIQIITLDDGVEVYCDEDALGKGLAYNRAVPATARPLPPGFTMENIIGWDPSMAKPGELGHHHIHGSFIICRHDNKKDTPTSLTADDVLKWLYTLLPPGVTETNPND